MADSKADALRGVLDEHFAKIVYRRKQQRRCAIFTYAAFIVSVGASGGRQRDHVGLTR